MSNIDIEALLDVLPEDTDHGDIVVLCGALISGFCDSPHEARDVVRDIINLLAAHYSVEPCSCPTCAAERKKGLH